MKYLGYYNGTYGPLEEMMIPMNDRVSTLETVYMTPHWPGTVKSLPWTPTWTAFTTVRAFLRWRFLIPVKNWLKFLNLC